LCFYLFREPFRVVSESYDDAIARGYNTLGWDFLFYALVGVVITTSVQIAGVVVVFTFLIIPATLSAVFASGWSGRLLVAWTTGALSTALGLMFAAGYDFSVGPAIALFLGAGLIVVGVLRAVRVAKVVTAGFSIFMFVVLGVWFASVSGAGDSVPVGATGGAPRAGSITHSHLPPGGAAHQSMAGDSAGVEIDPEALAALDDVGKLEAMYADAAGVEQRSMIACRTLEVDAHSGAQMAISFLGSDPPLLFRATVVDKLEEVTGKGLQYDIDQPFASPSNQQAVAGLKGDLGIE
jgi:hypothetical protein